MRIESHTLRIMEHIMQMLYREHIPTREEKDNLYEALIVQYEKSEMKERHTFDSFIRNYEIDLERLQK